MTIATFSAPTLAFEATGIFYVGLFGSFGNIYRYNVQNLQCSNNFYWDPPLQCNDKTEVTEIAGKAVAGYSNEMVKGLGIHGQSINFMPGGFEKHFPNIVGLELANSNVKVIRKRDLSPFKLLEEIFMHGNRFESLDLDTFEANPNIKYIFLANNDFKYLDPKTFAPLTNLLSIDLSANRCINTRASTPQQITELKAEMRLKCATVANQIADATKDESEIAKLKSEIEALKAIVMQYSNNHEYFKAHLKLLGKYMLNAAQNEQNGINGVTEGEKN